MADTTKNKLRDKNNAYQAAIFVLILTIVGIIFALSGRPKDYPSDSEPPTEFEMRGGNYWK